MQNNEIIVKRAKVRIATMQAQPIIGFLNLFSGKKRYKIKVGYNIKDEESLKLVNLPDDVLIGWFAHELGHVLDYRQYSNLQMLGFGIRYLFSNKHRKQVEHDADYIAIAHGFENEILALKQYILKNKLINEAYKNQIKDFYLPPKEVKVCAKDKELMKPYLDL
ncbi:MAG: hypothetical protein RJQ00_02085 [Vicingaceae bacterium]